MPAVLVEEESDDDTPRSSYSIERRRSSCSYPFSPFSDGFSRLSFSYHKLPPNLIKLSLVKLDASSFDVQIPGNATVGELKEAVVDIFAQSPKEGGGFISWSHVWGHFCLSYKSHKLTNDKDYVRSFGIKDGDQLQFIRHLSINYNLIKRKSKRESATCKEQSLSRAGSNVCDKYESDDGFFNNYRHEEDSSLEFELESNRGQHDDNSKYYNYENEGVNITGQQEFKLAHFLKGWLSYSSLWFVRRTKAEIKTRPSRFSGQFLKLGSKMTLTRL